MVAPIGPKVFDRDGKEIGTVTGVVLRPHSPEIGGIVVHQGVVRQRDLVVPIEHVTVAEAGIRLDLAADEVADRQFAHEPHHRRDLSEGRHQFWSRAPEAPLFPVETAAGAPPPVEGGPPAAPAPAGPAITPGMTVYDSAGQKVGEVEAVEFDLLADTVSGITVKRGFLFGREVPIPTSMIAQITDRVTLSVDADVVKRLEQPG